MKRKEFLKTLGGSAVGAGFLPTTLLQGCSGNREVPPTDFTAWTWVHGNAEATPQEWLARFTHLKESGFHAVLVSGGDTGVLSTAAHSAGLQFHRWMWILNRNGDTWAMENHPEWFTVNRNGDSTLDVPPYVGYYRWVCPTRAPVREYINGLIENVAADARVDGVHLDYIRHSDVILPRGLWEKYGLIQDVEHPEFDYCYCDVCRSTFEAEHGIDPMTLDDPPSNEEWVRFRWDSVTKIVTELAETTHSHGKPISAAVFPGPSLARQLVRQAWDEWPIDMVFPMLYHSFYLENLEWIGAMTREGVNAIKDSGTTLSPGLYLPDLDPEEFAEAIRISRNAGAAGVCTFEMNGLTDEHLAAIKTALG